MSLLDERHHQVAALDTVAPIDEPPCARQPAVRLPHFPLQQQRDAEPEGAARRPRRIVVRQMRVMGALEATLELGLAAD